ncbi:MAG: BatD family protein [bacterium]
MRNRLKMLLLVLAVALGGTARSLHAAEPTVHVEVDQDEVSMDDTFTMTVEIRGGSAMTTPDIPPLGNFDVVGRSTANAVEIINGEMSVSKTFTYVLSPRHVGEFNIGPVKVYIEGREYSAGPVRVKVTDSGGGGRGPQTYSPQAPNFPSMPQMPPMPNFPSMPGFPSFPMPGQGQIPPSPPGGAEKSYGDTFLTAETDRKEAYVGQQILFTFRLYSSVSIQGAQLSLPEFKDFFTEELVKERKYETQLNGRRYAVNEWRFAIFPTKAGTLQTGETRVKGNVPVRIQNDPFNDPFFQGFAMTTKPRTFSAPSVELKVKELPTPPQDFTGLVGNFAMASTLSKDTVNLGESTNLKVEISGKGNIREANLPELQELDYFKVYPSKPEVSLDRSLTGLSGKKTFEYALVADRPGSTSVPALEFSYFNPDTATFEKLSTAPLTVHILGSPSGEKLVTAGLEDSKGAVAPATGVFDLRPIKPAAAILYSQALLPWERAAGWGLLVGSPLAFFGLLGLQRYRARSLAHADDRKRSRAFRRAKAALQKQGGASAGDFSQISLVLKEYLSDRFLVKGTALTPMEIEELLKSRGVPIEVYRRMVYFMEQLDLWQYGGVSGQRPTDKMLKLEAMELLREIEKAT